MHVETACFNRPLITWQKVLGLLIRDNQYFSNNQSKGMLQINDLFDIALKSFPSSTIHQQMLIIQFKTAKIVNTIAIAMQKVKVINCECPLWGYGVHNESASNFFFASSLFFSMKKNICFVIEKVAFKFVKWLVISPKVICVCSDDLELYLI